MVRSIIGSLFIGYRLLGWARLHAILYLASVQWISIGPVHAVLPIDKPIGHVTRILSVLLYAILQHWVLRLGKQAARLASIDNIN
ncbi:hypothetical protein GGR51DRAFT_504971, partial [Nemania sp. FL0031]